MGQDLRPLWFRLKQACTPKHSFDAASYHLHGGQNGGRKLAHIPSNISELETRLRAIPPESERVLRLLSETSVDPDDYLFGGPTLEQYEADNSGARDGGKRTGERLL